MAGNKMVQKEADRQEVAIINKTYIMKEDQKRNEDKRKVYPSDSEQMDNSETGNAMGNRRGVSDMDNEATGSGSTEKGLEPATKNSVSGSDYDGQVSR